MATPLVLPILIPLGTAVALLLLRRWRRLQRAVGVAGAAALLAAGLALLGSVWDGTIHAVQLGSWPAPFGISFVADILAAVMVTAAALVGLVVAVYSLGAIDRGREAYGFHPLFHILLMGVCGAFLTGDLFNLYVWFEVLLIASFVLLSLGGERAQLEGAIKYVTLNLVASALFLSAVGIVYGLAGTLNMADLSLKLRGIEAGGLVNALAMLFLAAFGIKAAVFPLFFWLPASYHTPPVAVAALFSGLLTKVGVYALTRVFTLLFVGDPDFTHRLILVLAGLTMVTGVLGAVAQNEVRRLLAFHIISQIGYMILGLGLLTPLALGASLYYVVHNILAKTNLFLVAGIVERLRGSFDLKKLGGTWEAHPGVGVLFLISAFSLAGLPPLSGFFGKLALVQAGLAAGEYVLVATALGVSILTLFSMTKIWAEAFWKQGGRDAGRATPALVAPSIVLAAGTVLMGLGAGPLFDLALRCGGQLVDPAPYVAAVLGEGGR